eukprot:4426785-Prymnesium_polylepis.1
MCIRDSRSAATCRRGRPPPYHPLPPPGRPVPRAAATFAVFTADDEPTRGPPPHATIPAAAV